VVRRRIEHPGPAAAQRVDALPAGLRRLELVLQPGRPLLDALVAALPAGTASAVLSLGEATLFPFAWVMPALSKTPAHAVYFSDRFDAAAPVRLLEARVTYGRRDGQPWLHCHANWAEADGTPRCGHLLPEHAMLASPLAATAWVLEGAAFEVVPDDETRFALFRPVAQAGSAGQSLAVRLAPNEDVCAALEALCQQHGLARATVRGGVGSTVGAVFDDGRVVQPFVTEVLIREGRVRHGANGQPVADIDVSLVDYTGGLASGRLARGANPVLVTFELVLEPG
jgi:predicted DNA-binding protein with PD1-like motif